MSAASVWEIAIKRKIGKLSFRHDLLPAIAADGFETIDIKPEHAALSHKRASNSSSS